MATRQLIIFVLIVTLCLVVPSILLVLCLVFRFRAEGIHRQHRQTTGESAAEAGTGTGSGLDEFTIQSYKKVVIGENRRLLPACKNESSCPICLAEYLAGEIAKCMPECQHCFHLECVDKWLKINTTCPVCRKSLLFSKLHSDNLIPNL
ncbi:PREDICTED: RING-H2 finger protein ATL20-like [Nicotiana attenuata]|uniref:RING-type E3 ubiquitin transferase n=1 Tax=Nicotiana attenuata TaxID=49451 RepID=A0A1J6IQE6_NICAT|nr:PREDICTED: RING-H2 finger protein ATL20-like [Nicotiana attenuata]OIT07421.1 ring-h2 finger protein atl22 [Nicotiana attenuata]